MDEEPDRRERFGTGRPEDAHRPDADVELTVLADAAGGQPPMTLDLQVVCGLTWVAAAFVGGYGAVQLFAAAVGLLRGAAFAGLLAEVAALGAGQVTLFGAALLGVYWVVERRRRGVIALAGSLLALAAVGVVTLGTPFAAAALAGVVPVARNVERGFFEGV